MGLFPRFGASLWCQVPAQRFRAGTSGATSDCYVVQIVNAPIDVADITQLSDANFVRVSSDYLKATAVPYHVLQAAALLGFAVAAVAVSPWLLIPGAVTIAVLEITPFLRRLAFPYLGYQVREHDFSVRYGLITRTVETVPYNRIQNTEVNQGPLERRLSSQPSLSLQPEVQ